MAGIKISALPAVGAPLLTDIFPEVQPPSGVGATTYQVTFQQVLTLFNANIQIGESQVTNLTTDLAAKLSLSGGTMTGNLILNADPTTALQAVTKQYADNIAAGLNPLPGVVAATTGALTATYNNGSLGVGATLTNAGAFAVFSIDGQSPTVGQRVLIKNQASTFQNGVYTVTTVGDAISVNWVLTRATDYDTAGEISPGDLFAVSAGTVNGGASFLETATVAAMGTDAITFSPFFTPSSYVSSVLTSGHILVGSVGNVATSVAMSGDATIIASGALTIANSAVTNAKMANMNDQTIKGNVSGGAAAPSDLTKSQVLTMLGSTINQINTQTITATGAGTYTPTSGMKYCIIELQAGGGGSGGSTGAGGQSAVSGSGGGGGYLRLLATAAQIGASAAVSVGVGGAGGTSGNNAGGAGGNTTMTISASTWTAGGGAGGGGQAASAAAQVAGAAGAGGTNTTGANATLVLNIAGQQGDDDGFSQAAGGAIVVSRPNGGSSFLGKGSPGNAAGGQYGGGSGCVLNASGANLGGTGGGQGVIVITEFISA